MRFLALADPFGKINPTLSTIPADDPVTSLTKILNLGLELFLIVAGLYTLVNFLTAGYSYITSEGDSKKISQANSRITYTIIGLIIIVVTPLIAILIGIIVFKRWDALINPDIKTL
ncbi:MAG: hypothetical protein WCO06_00810 [Candidatus Roizmanbacteria bacterium]